MNIYSARSIINTIKQLKAKHDAATITSRDDMIKKFIAFAIEKRLGNYHLQLTPAMHSLQLQAGRNALYAKGF